MGSRRWAGVAAAAALAAGMLVAPGAAEAAPSGSYVKLVELRPDQSTIEVRCPRNSPNTLSVVARQPNYRRASGFDQFDFTCTGGIQRFKQAMYWYSEDPRSGQGGPIWPGRADVTIYTPKTGRIDLKDVKVLGGVSQISKLARTADVNRAGDKVRWDVWISCPRRATFYIYAELDQYNRKAPGRFTSATANYEAQCTGKVQKVKLTLAVQTIDNKLYRMSQRGYLGNIVVLGGSNFAKIDVNSHEYPFRSHNWQVKAV